MTVTDASTPITIFITNMYMCRCFNWKVLYIVFCMHFYCVPWGLLILFSLFVHCLFNPGHFFGYIDHAFPYTTSDALTNITILSLLCIESINVAAVSYSLLLCLLVVLFLFHYPYPISIHIQLLFDSSITTGHTLHQPVIKNNVLALQWHHL